MPGYSPVIPLQLDSQDGYALLKSLKEVISQNLRMLVLTCPGERVMIPDFGVGLRNFLFQQNTGEVYEDIRSEIHDQVDRWMPFVEIENITFVELDLDSSAMQIRYFVPSLNSSNVLELNLNYDYEAQRFRS